LESFESTEQEREAAEAAAAESAAQQYAADAALRVAIASGNLTHLRREIAAHGHVASPELFNDARLLRDKLRERVRKAARQRRRQHEAAREELRRAHQNARLEAHEALKAALQLQELVHTDGVGPLRAAIAASQAAARVLQGHGAEARVRAAQERLHQLEQEEAAAAAAEAAAAEAAAEEAAAEEATAAAAGDEEAVESGLATDEVTSATDEETVAQMMAAEAATAAAEMSRVQRAAVGAAAFAPPRPPSAEGRRVGECVVCLDRRNSHVLVPCGHRCVCASCAELVRTHGVCPICRTNIVWVCEVFE
jgi:hypothetical protein